MNASHSTSYKVGDLVEVVRNPQSVDRGISPAVWVQTLVERVGVRSNGIPEVYVRIDGALVTRQAKFVRVA